MSRLHLHLSVTTRVLLAMAATLFLVAGLGCTLVIADHVQEARARLLGEAIVEADLVAAHAASAVAAHDGFQAEAALNPLYTVPSTLAARFYDTSGRPVGQFETMRWRRLGGQLQFSGASGNRWLETHVEVVRPVIMAGGQVGWIVTATDLIAMRVDCVGFAIKASLIALLTLVIGYLLTVRATRAILEPFSALAGMMRRAVSETRDDVRAPLADGGEARTLGESFNALLDRLSEREDALRRELAERHHAQRRLDELAHYDTVTKLPNRHFFLRQLERVLLDSTKSGSAGALLLIDLNKLKHVNDTLGHDSGDTLLRQFAKRLGTSLRDHDVLCRLGGDQFALILTEISGESHLVSVATKLLALAREPVVLGELEITVSSSIGIAVFPVDGNEPQVLLRHAETALLRAKAAGKNNHVFFAPDMVDRDVRSTSLAAELQRAPERGELRLHYQPQVDLIDGKVRAMEALLRWEHPTRGLLLPGEFMELAEENASMIDAIADWTLAAACEQMCVWRTAGLQPVPIALNFSATQLRDRRLVTRLTELLHRYDVPSELLEIEIAENLLISEPGAHEVLQDLRGLGARVIVDHFGAGYSSLIQLKDLPVTGLKIDREFVHGVVESPVYASITRAIVSLAREIGLDTVAEGVESPRQVEFLRLMGCGAYQGYYLSPALPADAVVRYLQPMPVAQVSAPARLALVKGA
jgi:diguanylate cyclase (GGDEF)-like protein